MVPGSSREVGGAQPATCARCRKKGVDLLTLRTPSGNRAFCSQLCLTLCRKAACRNNTVCNWCGKIVRRTAHLVEARDAEGRALRLCSDTCLSQYKMHVFCTETRQQLHRLQAQLLLHRGPASLPSSGRGRGGGGAPFSSTSSFTTSSSSYYNSFSCTSSSSSTPTTSFSSSTSSPSSSTTFSSKYSYTSSSSSISTSSYPSPFSSFARKAEVADAGWASSGVSRMEDPLPITPELWLDDRHRNTHRPKVSSAEAAEEKATEDGEKDRQSDRYEQSGKQTYRTRAAPQDCVASELKWSSTTAAAVDSAALTSSSGGGTGSAARPVKELGGNAAQDRQQSLSRAGQRGEGGDREQPGPPCCSENPASTSETLPRLSHSRRGSGPSSVPPSEVLPGVKSVALAMAELGLLHPAMRCYYSALCGPVLKDRPRPHSVQRIGTEEQGPRVQDTDLLPSASCSTSCLATCTASLWSVRPRPLPSLQQHVPLRPFHPGVSPLNGRVDLSEGLILPSFLKDVPPSTSSSSPDHPSDVVVTGQPHCDPAVMGQSHCDPAVIMGQSHCDPAVVMGQSHCDPAVMGQSHCDPAVIMGQSHCDPAVMGQSHCDPAVMGQPHCDPAVMGQPHCDPTVMGQPHCDPAVMGQSHCDPAVMSQSHCDPAVMSQSHCDPAVMGQSHCDPAVMSQSHCDPDVMSQQLGLQRKGSGHLAPPSLPSPHRSPHLKQQQQRRRQGETGEGEGDRGNEEGVVSGGVPPVTVMIPVPVIVPSLVPIPLPVPVAPENIEHFLKAWDHVISKNLSPTSPPLWPPTVRGPFSKVSRGHRVNGPKGRVSSESRHSSLFPLHHHQLQRSLRTHIINDQESTTGLSESSRSADLPAVHRNSEACLPDCLSQSSFSGTGSETPSPHRRPFDSIAALRRCWQSTEESTTASLKRDNTRDGRESEALPSYLSTFLSAPQKRPLLSAFSASRKRARWDEDGYGDEEAMDLSTGGTSCRRTPARPLKDSSLNPGLPSVSTHSSGLASTAHHRQQHEDTEHLNIEQRGTDNITRQYVSIDDAGCQVPKIHVIHSHEAPPLAAQPLPLPPADHAHSTRRRLILDAPSVPHPLPSPSFRWRNERVMPRGMVDVATRRCLRTKVRNK